MVKVTVVFRTWFSTAWCAKFSNTKTSQSDRWIYFSLVLNMFYSWCREIFDRYFENSCMLCNFKGDKEHTSRYSYSKDDFNSLVA